MDQGLSVRRPVFIAAGSVEDCVLKYAPYGQPSQHASRYWHALRPGSACVRFAVRAGIQRRLPSKCCLTRSATCCSAQLNGIGGWNLPSGSCGMCSMEPEIPAKGSTWSYHGEMSL